MFNAYYITRVSLPGWLVAWTSNQKVWGSNPLPNKRVFQGIVARLTARWLAFTMWYIGKNRRDIADFGEFLPKYRRTDISPWNIVSTPLDTRYIADISRNFPPCPWLCPYSQHKLDSHSIPCVFLGYSSTQSAYICLDLSTSKTYISHHVKFLENTFPFTTHQSHLARPTT